MFLLLGSLAACMAPDALSDDEDVLPGPTMGDVGDEVGVADTGGAASAGSSLADWLTDAQPTDAAAADGTLRALRIGTDSVLCQHTALVAACGTLTNEGAIPNDAGATVAYTLTTGSDGGLCVYTASYLVAGVTGGEGTITATLAVDGGAARTLDVAGAYEAVPAE